MSAHQEIYVLNKRLKLLHTQEGFKTSIDSILLAASCPAKAGDHILDMGCGVGGAGLSVLSRVDAVTMTGVEIQAEHAKLAQENAIINDMQDRASFVTSDIRDYREEIAYDHIICNPPYLEAGAHLRSPSKEKAIAMGHEEEGLSVKDWVDCACFCLKSKGSVIIIHRADKTDKIIHAFGKRFGAIEIFPLWPRYGENAKRVIIRAVKGRKSSSIIHSGLILHNKDSSYTVEAEGIFRDVQALF